MNRIFATLVFLLALTANAAVEMAITVDDLPSHGKLPSGVSRVDVAKKLLEVFKKHKVPEVYGFINAGKTEFQKEDEVIFKMWRQAGFPLGNHAYSHMDLHKNSTDDFTKDILRNEGKLKELNGALDWHWFRYPFLREGNELTKRNAVRAFLKDHGYKIAQVSVDFEDWSWNGPYARCADKKDAASVQELKNKYLKFAGAALDQSQQIFNYLYKREVRQILLLHIGAFDAEMLDELLSLYEKKGVKFITLAEASKDEVYSIDPGQVGKWGSEIQFQILKSKGLSLKDIGVESVPYPEDELAKVCN